MYRKYKTFIKIRTQKEGFHMYENSPEEVNFLRHPHRHLFKIELKIQTFHDDRELEFFIVKRAFEKWLDESLVLNYNGSCETMAKVILDEFVIANYGELREIQVVVSEDGENDGIVEYNFEATR